MNKLHLITIEVVCSFYYWKLLAWKATVFRHKRRLSCFCCVKSVRMRFSLFLFENLCFRNKSSLCILKLKKCSFSLIICLTWCLKRLTWLNECLMFRWLIKNPSRWNWTFVFQIFRHIELRWSLLYWSKYLLHNFISVHVAYGWTFKSCLNTIPYFLRILVFLIYLNWVVPLWTLFAQGLLHSITCWQLRWLCTS